VHRLCLGSVASTALVILFLGCSSSTNGGGAAPAGPGDDGSTPSGDGATTTADGDAPARPTEDILVEVTHPSSPPGSCSTVCQSEKYTCATTCNLGEDAGVGAGSALYGDSFTGFTSQTLASCDDAPKASVSGSSGPQNLNVYDCCCRSPKHEKVDGPMLPLEACTAVCAAKGLLCDEFTTWDGADTTSHQGGCHASYDDGGATSFATFGCDTPPSPTHKQGSLVAYQCGCY
jgi:hypothetical protein